MPRISKVEPFLKDKSVSVPFILKPRMVGVFISQQKKPTLPFGSWYWPSVGQI